MQPKEFHQNKKTYLAYNDFRKGIFSELTPKDSETILYLLPWLLCVNDPSVAGYVPNLKKPISVSGAVMHGAIFKREPACKKIFGIKKQGSLMPPAFAQVALIQGIYTIGSVGTVSQTALSDCDIWICIDKDNFTEGLMDQLSQKVYLIKDWMDANLKMPVYFFISDVEDIRNANFGTLDDESCGSAQRNVLKEEFYRTMIMIAGKIPLWWLCYAPGDTVDYQELCDQYRSGIFGDFDCLDMGGLDYVAADEYFGAALWQLNKALTHPLKSIIKMLLLEMLLLSSGEGLLCNRFRKEILTQGKDLLFVDPSMFTMSAVLQHNQGIDAETYEFIKKCFYLRYEFKFFTKNEARKETLAREIYLTYPLSPDIMYSLNSFSTWPLPEQLEFGERIFVLLVNIYKDITTYRKDIASAITPEDMAIIGRKLSVCLERKQNKITVVHKPLLSLARPSLIFSIDKKAWYVFNTSDAAKPVVYSMDIVYCIAYLTWNDLYQTGDVRMKPNPTPVTINEINNLAKRIRETFGAFDVTEIDFKNFLEPERVTKMLIVISFEGFHHAKDVNDLCVIYINHWGELFVQRFNSPEKLKEFIAGGGRKFSRTEIFYYIQRNSLAYEKIIERTKKLVTQIFANITPVIT